jgi:hypothetical protein
VSKPRKSAPKFSPHKWGVTLNVAFARIEAAARAREFAEEGINEGLRSGRLKSGEWQISPAGGGRWRPLKSSEWAQRRVGSYYSMFAPRPGVFSLSPREGTFIEGPQFAGQVFICRADLDEYYPTAAASTVTQSDDIGPTKSDRRKPGPKMKHDWKLRLANELHRIKEHERRTPTAKELAQFCRDEWDYEPDLSEIQKLMRSLLND